MRSMISEYGLAVLYIIVVSAFLFIFAFFFSDIKSTNISGEKTSDKSAAFVYNTNMLYANDLFTDAASGVQKVGLGNGILDQYDGVTNQYDGMNQPVFKEVGITESDFLIPVSISSTSMNPNVDTGYQTVSSLFSLFSALNKISVEHDGADGSRVTTPLKDLIDSDGFSIVITRFTSKRSGSGVGSSGDSIEPILTPVMDKYGNYVYDSNGNIVTKEQVEFKEKEYYYSKLDNNLDEFVINWDEACRYRVLVRYSEGTLRSEYSAMFANKVRPATEIYEQTYEEWVYEEED